jgi:hypothetical protein
MDNMLCAASPTATFLADTKFGGKATVSLLSRPLPGDTPTRRLLSNVISSPFRNRVRGRRGILCWSRAL